MSRSGTITRLLSCRTHSNKRVSVKPALMDVLRVAVERL
jgi:hypothetical protein